jgi:glycosyltransferase involved in cell wall biosynthesis
MDTLDALQSQAFRRRALVKVLIVNYRYFVSGGPERYMFGVSRLLEQAGHEVVPFSVRYTQNLPSEWSDYFVSPIAGEEAVYYREHSRSLRVALKSLERAFYSPEVYRSLTRLVRVEKPDVALVLHYLRKLSPSVLTALRDNGVPIVVRLSDFAMVCPQQSLVRDGRICEACVGRTMLPSVRYRCVQGSIAASVVNATAMAAARRLRWFDAIDRFIAPSSVMREKMVAGGYGAERIVHLPTFVALQPPDPPPERRRRIAYVGRLEPIKGTDVLVEAFAALRGEPDLRDVDLAIVGDDSTPHARLLRERVRGRRIKNVVFSGVLDEAGVVQMLSSSLLSVVPSVWHENLPNTLLESLACGTPVVGSNVSAIAEVLDGCEAGALFEPGDSAGLARVLARLLRDRLRLDAMSLEARHLATTRFSPARHLDSLVGVLEEEVASPQPWGRN